MAGTSIVNANDLAGALQQLNDRMEALEKAGGSVPVGFVGHVPGVVPDGWLLCDGSVIDADRYGQLVAYLGTTTLPNLAGRVVVGQSGSFALGGTGGASSVTLSALESGQKAVATGTESATHVHTILGTSGVGGGGTLPHIQAGVSNDVNATSQAESATHTHSIAGSAATNAHENMPPYLVLIPIIKF